MKNLPQLLLLLTLHSGACGQNNGKLLSFSTIAPDSIFYYPIDTTDYLDYHRLIFQAEQYFLDGEDSLSLEVYRKIFDAYSFIFAKDAAIAAQVAAKTGALDFFLHFTEKAFRSGVMLDCLMDIPVLARFVGREKLKDTLAVMNEVGRKQYLAGINLEQKQRYIQRYREEQAFKKAKAFESYKQAVLANVILFWNAVQHFYPYRGILGVGDGWQQKIGWMLRQAAEVESSEAFGLFFKSCAALLKDGHAGLVHESELDDMWLPLELGWMEGQLVVTESGLPGQISPGDILKKIDGQDAAAAFHRDTALYSGTQQWKVARALKNLGAGEQYSTAALELERGGRTFRVEVQRDWGDFPEPALFRELEPGYSYVNLAAIYDIDTLLQWAPRLAEAEGVIFDVRGYLQNNCSRFLPHLLSKTDTAGNWIRIPQLVYPDFFQPSFEASGWLLTPEAPRIEGRLAFLTDGRAVSASESFLAFVRHYQLGPIIGGPTAGANGPRNWMRLLDGYILHWTGAYVTLPDGSPLHNKGIAPDYSAAPTLNGILNGRDEVLEFALAVLKGNKK